METACEHAHDTEIYTKIKQVGKEEHSHDEVPFLGALAQLLHIPADANDHEQLEAAETIEARCSHCEEECTHRLVERNNVRKDEYCCSKCSERTCKCLKFDTCHGAAKSNFLWDDALCTECDHAVEQFASGDISIQALVDELQLQGVTVRENEPCPASNATEITEEKIELRHPGRDAVIKECLAGSESIEAFCSHCSTTSKHQLVERHRARKDEYICTACTERTCKCLKYGICHGAAKSNFLWDDALCGECDRQFAASHSTRGRPEYEKRGREREDALNRNFEAMMVMADEERMSRVPSEEKSLVSPDNVVSLKKALQQQVSKIPRPFKKITRRKPDDVLEPWEVLRDALLSYPCPQQRADVEKYRKMCCHKAWLNRWIIGSEMDPAYAMRRILVHLKWRQDYKLDTIMDEDWSEFDARGEMTVSGVDRDGRPTWTWNCNKHDARQQTPEMAARYLICTLERAWAVNPQANRLNVLCNCRNLVYDNYEHAMFLICVATLSEQYPDNLERTYMFPASWVIRTLLATGSMFLSAETMSKLVPATEGDLKEVLARQFENDQVEPQFGGTLDLEKAAKRRMMDEDAEMKRVWDEEELYAAVQVRPTQAVRALQLQVMGKEDSSRLRASGYDKDSAHFDGSEEDAEEEEEEEAVSQYVPEPLDRSLSFSTAPVSEEEWGPEDDGDDSGPDVEEGALADAAEEAAQAAQAAQDGEGQAVARVAGAGMSSWAVDLVRSSAEGVMERAGIASAVVLGAMMQVVWAGALVAINALKRTFVKD